MEVAERVLRAATELQALLPMQLVDAQAQLKHKELGSFYRNPLQKTDIFVDLRLAGQQLAERAHLLLVVGQLQNDLLERELLVFLNCKMKDF
jgi:hypothetical protein